MQFFETLKATRRCQDFFGARERSTEDQEKKSKNGVTTGKSEADLRSANRESPKAVSVKAGTIFGLEILYEPPDHSNAVVE